MKNVKKNFLKSAKLLVLIVCAAGFFLIAENVARKKILKIDVATYNFISNYVMSDFLTPVVKFATNLGGPIFLIGAAIVLFVIIKNKKIGIAIILNLGISAAFNQLLKQIFKRERPNELRIVNESGYSFPSGHSMASLAFYGFIIYLIYKNVKNRRVKLISILLLGALIFIIGTSRIYLGVHYASDVAAGFLFSIFYLIIFTEITRKFTTKNERAEK